MVFTLLGCHIYPIYFVIGVYAFCYILFVVSKCFPGLRIFLVVLSFMCVHVSLLCLVFFLTLVSALYDIHTGFLFAALVRTDFVHGTCLLIAALILFCSIDHI